jgi:hypothetical protein
MSCRFTLYSAQKGNDEGEVAEDQSTAQSTGPRRAAMHGFLACMDGGHPTDAYLAEIEAAQEVGEELPVLDTLVGTYGRWAARLANEYKLKFGIPKRTEANRLVVREWLHKHLVKRNTRYQHMRSVIPLAVEMCFLKDATDLELDSIMLDPAMVRRAQQSVTPYWTQTTWAGWLVEKVLPPAASRALAKAFPGTFRRVPGFSA